MKTLYTDLTDAVMKVIKDELPFLKYKRGRKISGRVHAAIRDAYDISTSPVVKDGKLVDKDDCGVEAKGRRKC